MIIDAVIPARLASSRFPNKPLADILGLPMIEHVRRRVCLCKKLNKVFVATCDSAIFDLVRNNNGLPLITSDAHRGCIDRAAEAALSSQADFIILVQGDSPLVYPDEIDLVISEIEKYPEAACINLMTPVKNETELYSKNTVKVVCSKNGEALYFSREPIPTPKKNEAGNFMRYKQQGIFGFRKDILLKYKELKDAPLEIAESVDVLRFIENGLKIRMVKNTIDYPYVDTPSDIELVISGFKNDPYFKKYK